MTSLNLDFHRCNRDLCRPHRGVSYLSGRAAAAARFGSRFWRPERRWSLRAAAAAEGGGTPSGGDEAPRSSLSLIFTGLKVEATGHITLQTAADGQRTEEGLFLDHVSSIALASQCRFELNSSVAVKLFIDELPVQLFLTSHGEGHIFGPE